MNQFSLPRFWRLLQNDALRVLRPVGYATLALLGLTVLIYWGNPGMPIEPPNVLMFAAYLLAGGVLFTSISFHDMHDPLERYQYLMLPVSNFERFLSRYLLTGPLFVVFAALAFCVMDWVGNQVAEWLNGSHDPLFAPFSRPILGIVRIYLAVHLIALTGAICFRSHALIKTALALLLVHLGAAATAYLSMRIIYLDAFEGLSLDTKASLPMPLEPLFTANWMNYFVAYGLAAWILYVAYRCLKAHEVQDEL